MVPRLEWQAHLALPDNNSLECHLTPQLTGTTRVLDIIGQLTTQRWAVVESTIGDRT